MDRCYQCTLVCLTYKIKDQKRDQEGSKEKKCLLEKHDTF